ncbi:MBL fold metallo-hydrolase [Scatolibacter rhodanostii]|uniref:MBL fold metallo-hydrolase n=1 Tax=Scatolibacter rhodanostii TaxID=2014781 RepID=UPI000C06ADF9|nr:MBL fold metallo-hydrolase [Scatolibacter rhodanostii]
MNIKYLGTAAAEGWPGIFCHCEACEKARKLGGKNIRSRSQSLVDDCLLIDYPPDGYWHMIRNNLSFGKIATLLVTHSHQDHFYPLDLILRAEPYCYKLPTPLLTIYGNRHVEEEYHHALKEVDCNGIAQSLHFQRIEPFKSFTISEGYTITPLLANHGSAEEDCLIYLIEKDGKTLFYANDSGLYPEATWEYLRGRHLDLISFDCTGVIASAGSTHMNLETNRVAKKRLIELGCADEHTTFVINHFSHNGILMHDEILDATKEDAFLVSYDGFSVDF